MPISGRDLVRFGLKSNHVVKPFPLSRTSQNRSAGLQPVSQSLKDLSRIRRWCHMAPKDSALHGFMCISSQKTAGAIWMPAKVVTFYTNSNVLRPPKSFSRFEWPPCTTLAPVPSVHPARILWQSFLSHRPPSESSSDRWLLGCIKHRRVSRSVRRPVYSLLPSADSVEVHQLQLGHLLFCTPDAVDYDSVDQWDSSYM